MIQLTPKYHNAIKFNNLTTRIHKRSQNIYFIFKKITPFPCQINARIIHPTMTQPMPHRSPLDWPSWADRPPGCSCCGPARCVSGWSRWSPPADCRPTTWRKSPRRASHRPASHLARPRPRDRRCPGRLVREGRQLQHVGIRCQAIAVR